MKKIGILILISALSAACSKQMDQFVSGAVRAPAAVPISSLGSADTVKFSSGHMRSAGTVNSSQITISPTQLQTTGTHLSMTIGISQSPVITQ